MKKVNSKQLILISMLIGGSLSEIANCATATKPATPTYASALVPSKPHPDVAALAEDAKELLSATQPSRVRIKEQKQHIQDEIDKMHKESVDCDHERSALYKEQEKVQKKLDDNFNRKLSINDKLLNAYHERTQASQEIIEHDKKVVPLYEKLAKDADVIARQ